MFGYIGGGTVSLLLSILFGRLYIQGGLIYDLGFYDSLFSSSCACIFTNHKSHVNGDLARQVICDQRVRRGS
jgi:hypothetical protein